MGAYHSDGLWVDVDELGDVLRENAALRKVDQLSSSYLRRCGNCRRCGGEAVWFGCQALFDDEASFGSGCWQLRVHAAKRARAPQSLAGKAGTEVQAGSLHN